MVWICWSIGERERETRQARQTRPPAIIYNKRKKEDGEPHSLFYKPLQVVLPRLLRARCSGQTAIAVRGNLNKRCGPVLSRSANPANTTADTWTQRGEPSKNHLSSPLCQFVKSQRISRAQEVHVTIWTNEIWFWCFLNIFIFSKTCKNIDFIIKPHGFGHILRF